MGGHAAKIAREDIERNLGETVVTKENKLDYKYIENSNKENQTLDKNTKNIQSAQTMEKQNKLLQ